jgi:hypothetical protein
MDGMGTAPVHAKRGHRDHLWAPLTIAAASGLEVCATWTGVGSRSGFPVIRLPFGIARIPTDFCLMLCMEAYSAYALLIWLRASGRRSGPFAMWSGLAAILLSLTAQVAYHVMGARAIMPAWLVGLVSALPVIALLLAVLLIHLVRLDREETAEADRASTERTELTRLSAETTAWKAAWGKATAAAEAGRQSARAEAEAEAAGERAALRAELDALRGTLETAQAERETARRELAQALTRAENLAKKLAAKNAQKPRNGKQESAQAEDLTTEFRAFELLRDNPELRAPRMGAELGRRLGASDATGRRLHGRLIVGGQLVQPLTEPLADRSPNRSGERS